MPVRCDSSQPNVVSHTSLGFGAALVGETKQITLQPQAAPGTDALKALYRRPATIPFPKDNTYTPEKAALGKKLYFDTRISVTSAQSCGSCHSPSFGWGDGLAVGVGYGMQKLGRHSPTVVNAAWGGIFMWDGRLATLEEQALGPIQAAGEMNMPLEQLMNRLGSIPEYKPLFVRIFPEEGMTPKTLAKAIATYERTVVSERAPFDAWIDGDGKAISEEPSAGSSCLTAKRNARHATKAGISPTMASRTLACPVMMSAAPSSSLVSSRWNTPSRRLACARSRAVRHICTMARWRRSNWSSSTMIMAVSIAQAGPTS